MLSFLLSYGKAPLGAIMAQQTQTQNKTKQKQKNEGLTLRQILRIKFLGNYFPLTYIPASGNKTSNSHRKEVLGITSVEVVLFAKLLFHTQ